MSQKLFLAPYVRAGFQNGKLYFGFGSLQQVITDNREQAVLAKVASFWKAPQTKQEIIEALKKETDQSLLSWAIDFLDNGNYLIEENAYSRSDRYSRGNLFWALSGADPKFVQSSLKSKTVAILGSGGIGNVMGVNLATAGIGKLVLVDNDSVELSNLTRQILFEESDVGFPKTATLKERLLARNSEVAVETANMMITSENQLEALGDVDLFVVSADAGNVLDIVNTYCVRKIIPFINVGYIEDIALFGPFVIPGLSGCMRCQVFSADMGAKNSIIKEDIKKINSSYQSPSIGPVNMLAASFATLDVIKYFGNFGTIQSLNKRVGYWSHDFHFEYQDFARNVNCTVCGVGKELAV